MSKKYREIVAQLLQRLDRVVPLRQNDQQHHLALMAISTDSVTVVVRRWSCQLHREEDRLCLRGRTHFSKLTRLPCFSKCAYVPVSVCLRASVCFRWRAPTSDMEKESAERLAW